MPKNSAKQMAAEEVKFRAEDDLRTLLRAEEIKRDAARMRAVKKCAREKRKDLDKLPA